MSDNISYTPQEVANILKISKSTVYELMRRKELNAYRVGKKLRVDQADVENYKNKTKETPTSAPQFAPSYPSAPLRGLVAYDTEAAEAGRSFIISGQDVLLDILSRYLSAHPLGVRALRSYEGSYNALYALYQEQIQIATAHMWDGKTGQYNTPYVERMLPGLPAVIVRLASRMQGFYVQKGNPKNIKGWEDLKRTDLTLVNREKGSGTRILLDEHLKLLGISPKNIPGYTRECQTHLAVASTVARGGADLGMGNEKANLQVQGIDFIPLQKEQYDMIFRKEDMDRPPFQAIMEIIQAEAFRLEIEGIGGYDLSEMGKIIATT